MAEVYCFDFFYKEVRKNVLMQFMRLDFILKLLQKEIQVRGETGGTSVCHFS